MLFLIFGFILCFYVDFSKTATNIDEKRLHDDLLKGYNRLVRPVTKNTDKLTVLFGLKLTQILDVEEKNQILVTSVWLRQEWIDVNLKWDPKNYSNINSMFLPSANIWTPDLILFNSADGKYDATSDLMTKATIYYNGTVIWEPPAIYKSSCIINVEFFPFDQQNCIMKFGSWTYDGSQVELIHKNQPRDEQGNLISEEIPVGIDLRDFYRSVEWDIMSVAAVRNYENSLDFFPDLTFNITIRRKTLFYSVNLIMPCIGISFLTVLTFYLPSHSGEKIVLCVSILLSLTVFFLLLNELIPPTSLVVPLIGKYLLFTMILVTLSITITVIVLNVHFRSPATHSMPPWVKRVFLHVLPKLLLMRRPQPPPISFYLNSYAKATKALFSNKNNRDSFEFHLNKSEINSMSGGGGNEEDESSKLLFLEQKKPLNNENKRISKVRNSDVSRRIIYCVKNMAENLKNEDEEKKVQEEWKYVALVIDRLFLWIFTTACIIGTCGIVLQAPSFYDKNTPIDGKISQRFDM